MAVIDCATGAIRDHTAEELAASEAERQAFRRLIPKSVVQERVESLGKLEAARALLRQPGYAIYEMRWLAPDWPNVYFDDEGLLQILAAIDCTDEEAAFVTGPV